MLKISRLVDGKELRHDSPKLFTRQLTHRGTDARLVISLPHDEQSLMRSLALVLKPPFQILYVLHAPGPGAEAGRYQSPELSAAELEAFLRRFEPFLAGDARHDIWVRSIGSECLLVWDRHHELFAYGETELFIRTLNGLGYSEGSHIHIGPHHLHYRRELDAEQAALLAALPFAQGPLQPGDRRYEEDREG